MTDNVEGLKLGEFANLEGFVDSTNILSPLKKNCSYWCFEIYGQSTSQGKPKLISFYESKNKWLFLEQKEHVVGLKIDPKKILLEKSFSFKISSKKKPPPKLTQFLNSEIFRFTEPVSKIPFNTTINEYRELVLPSLKKIRASGQVTKLDKTEVNELNEYRKQYQIPKPLLPVTLGGEFYFITIAKTDWKHFSKIKNKLIRVLLVTTILIILIQIFN